MSCQMVGNMLPNSKSMPDFAQPQKTRSRNRSGDHVSSKYKLYRGDIMPRELIIFDDTIPGSSCTTEEDLRLATQEFAATGKHTPPHYTGTHCDQYQQHYNPSNTPIVNAACNHTEMSSLRHAEAERDARSFRCSYERKLNFGHIKDMLWDKACRTILNAASSTQHKNAANYCSRLSPVSPRCPHRTFNSNSSLGSADSGCLATHLHYPTGALLTSDRAFSPPHAARCTASRMMMPRSKSAGALGSRARTHTSRQDASAILTPGWTSTFNGGSYYSQNPSQSCQVVRQSIL